MMASLPQREVSGSRNELLQEDCLEGTSARTRPLHFDEIILRRKNRGGEVKQVADDPGVSDIALARDSSKKVLPSVESQGLIGEDVPKNARHTSNDSQNVSSRRKESANSSRKNGKLLHEKDKGSRDHDAKSKAIVDENVKSNRVTGGENEIRHHRSRNKDGFSRDDSNTSSSLKQPKVLGKNDRAPERTRVKSEIVREQRDNGDRHADRKRKIDERTSSFPENDFKKKNATDVKRTDKLSDGSKDKSEKENRHKRHNEEDKTKGRSTVKKHYSENKPELKRIHPEESRPKKRRSRSRDRDRERGRRSPSHSPKAHEQKSTVKRNHREPSPQSTKNRAVREHSDVDKKRISSSHYRRNTGSSSGLGGYSPRKRKSETAAKTPSPSHRSPEKRTAGWDLPLVGKENITASTTHTELHSSSQNFSSEVKELPSVTPMTPTMLKPVGIAHLTLASQMHAIDSIQLTQATRPMRRLYVENIPFSASEKDLMECINKFLMSSGLSYIQGTQRCISCIIHKEKGQALLEFLTPEDASAALSFDGLFFSGSNLKFRRPKDYADVTTGLPEKSVVAVDSVSSVVKDSPHKIFVGGISKLISAKMLLEIAKAFGAVKAYHFEFIADSNEQCAFLEYVDHSVNSKACSGLSGMRLGGQVITAVFATPDPSFLEKMGELPFYGIPQHAKPLLEKPTTVLKLKNVLDPEGLLSLSEPELDEIVEDIRLECSRFGMVKSINVAKPANSCSTVEAHKTENTDVSTGGCGFDVDTMSPTRVDEVINVSGDHDRTEPPESRNENNIETAEDNIHYDHLSNVVKNDEIHGRPSDGGHSLAKDPSNLESHDGFTENLEVEDESLVEENLKIEEANAEVQDESLVKENLKIEEANAEVQDESLVKENLKIEEANAEVEDESLVEENLKIGEANAEIENAGYKEKELDNPKEDHETETASRFGNVFEPGSVFVEYKRAEAACTAAHSLHRRTFDDRVVMVEYVAHDLYQMKFHK